MSKKKDKEERSKNGKSHYDQSSESESITKKPKKHKHKRSKDKSSKKEKRKGQQSSSLVDFYNEDVEMTTEDTDQMEDVVMDGSALQGNSVHMQIGEDGDITKMGKDKSEHSRSKKSKKKDKYKDRGETKVCKKEKKLFRKECKLEGDGKREKKEGRPEKKGNKDDDGTDSEEERWLHAIESGTLAEVDDELKRIRNPRLLTARQRALMEKQRPGDGGPDEMATCAVSCEEQQDLQLAAEEPPVIIPPEPLLALPSGFKEKVVTQEMLEKKAIKSQRRREQALEKREEDKKKTVDRLLKKQDSKLLRSGFNKRVVKTEVEMFSYRNNVDGILLSFPIGFDYPILPQKAKTPPPVKLCGVAGCTNAKRYNCSKTGVPLCSLNCYNTNLRSADLICGQRAALSVV